MSREQQTTAAISSANIPAPATIPAHVLSASPHLMTASPAVLAESASAARAQVTAGGDGSAAVTTPPSRSISASRRSISVHSFNTDVNRQLARIAGREFKSDLYMAIFEIFKARFSEAHTHKIHSFVDAMALRKAVVSHIKEHATSYIRDIALEISEIATNKCTNRFSGEFKNKINEFITSTRLAELLNKDDERPLAIKKLLDFLTPEVLENYYQFVSTQGTAAGELELKALVQIFETNIMLFRESLRITITHSPHWPHIYLHNSKPGIYRLLNSIESLKESLEPPKSVFIGDDHGTLPFLALSPQLTGRPSHLAPGFSLTDSTASTTGAGAAARESDESGYNAAELALIEKLRLAAEQAVLKKESEVEGTKTITGSINLAALKTIIPDRFTHNRNRYEKSRLSQAAVLRARILVSRSRLLDEKSRLLTQYQEAIQTRAATLPTLTQIKEAFLKAIKNEIEADCADTRKYVRDRGAWLDETNGLARFSATGENDADLSLNRLMDKYRSQLVDNLNSLIASLNEWPSDRWLLLESQKLTFVQDELNSIALEKEFCVQESSALDTKADQIAEEIYEAELEYGQGMTERLRIMLTREGTAASARGAGNPSDLPSPSVAPLAVFAARFNRNSATPTSRSDFRPLTPVHTDTVEMGTLLARHYPGVREAKISLILFEGLPADIRDKDNNTLLHLALANELKFYDEELKEVADYLINRGASVSCTNRFFHTPPSLITSKISYNQVTVEGTPSHYAKLIFNLCEQAYVFEQQEDELTSHIDRFVVDMTGHIDAYRALSEERRESLWFKWFQTSTMNAKRKGEVDAIEELVKKIKVSRYQVLSLIERITNRSRQAYWGLLKGSRFHGPVIVYAGRLQESRDFRRAALVHAEARYDYWELMSQQNMAGLEARLVHMQAEAERKAAEARAETATAREETRAETDRKLAEAVTKAQEAARVETDKKVAEARAETAAMREETDRKVAEARAETAAVREETDKKVAYAVAKAQEEDRTETDKKVAEARAETATVRNEADRKVAEARAETAAVREETDKKVAYAVAKAQEEDRTETDKKVAEAVTKAQEAARLETERQVAGLRAEVYRFFSTQRTTAAEPSTAASQPEAPSDETSAAPGPKS